MGESGSVKIKNGLLKIPKIISWAMTILSLFFSWLSINSGDLVLEWYIIITIIIGNSVFLIVCSLYEGFLYKKFTSQIQLVEKKCESEKEKLEIESKRKSDEKDREIESLNVINNQLSNEIDNLKTLNETVIRTFLEITNKYNYYSLKLLSINDSYIGKMKNLAQASKKIESSDNVFSEIKSNYDNEYIKEVVEVYNEFMDLSTQNLKVALDNYLKSKEVGLGVSITIKQLNRIVVDIKEIKDVKVITTFRDKETYIVGDREVGKKQYTIYGNTDFLHCLRNSSYINNNLLNDDSYNNENPNYKNQYTCTAVVPIVWQHGNVVKFYGYLTCDAYDSEQEYSNIMDKNIAYMMNSTASLLARYFDDLQYSVQNMAYKNFFNELYEIKLGGVK